MLQFCQIISNQKTLHVQAAKKHLFTGHRDCVYTLQSGGEPHLFFSGGGDGFIARWNLETGGDGELIGQLPHSVYALHYLPEKKLLVAGQNYSGIHLIDDHNKKEVASLQLTTAAIFDIQSFQNDLIAGTGDGALTIIDLDRWAIKKKIAVTEKSVRTVAVNPALGEMAVGFSDHCIRIFDLDQYQVKKEIKAHANSVFTLSYSPDNHLLFSGSRDARIKTWDVQAGYSLSQEVVAHTYAINHIVFSPSGKNFATGSLDKTIKIWEADNLKLLKVLDKSRHGGHSASVNKMLWTAYNQQLVSASDDRTISAWDLLFL